MTSYERLQAKCARAMKKTGFTEEEVRTLQAEAFGLYQYIGGDLPAENRRGTVRRAVIIEVVLDAGRLEQQLRQRKRSLNRQVESQLNKKNVALADKLRKTFDNGNFSLVEDLIGPAFPYKEYEAGQPMEE